MIVVGLLLGVIGTDVSSGASGLPSGPGTDGRNRFRDSCDGYVRDRRDHPDLEREGTAARKVLALSSFMPMREDWKRMIAPTLRGTFLGAFLGILPGGGALVASFAAYSLEKKVSKHSADLEGGLSKEWRLPSRRTMPELRPPSSDAYPRDPTSPVMALMIGAMIIQGVQPGPAVMTEQPTLFWGVIVSMWIGNLILLVLNLPMIGSGSGSAWFRTTSSIPRYWSFARSAYSVSATASLTSIFWPFSVFSGMYSPSSSASLRPCFLP